MNNPLPLSPQTCQQRLLDIQYCYFGLEALMHPNRVLCEEDRRCIHALMDLVSGEFMERLEQYEQAIKAQQALDEAPRMHAQGGAS